jgi:hypothetical protein
MLFKDAWYHSTIEGKMAGKSERAKRLQVELDAHEVTALNNWRFEKRMPSRAAAFRELLNRGLVADGYVHEDDSFQGACDRLT